ncbi:MAG: glutamate--tRNA ligase [Firmicutes bacterium]|nr:glutamate--tRNA ligase [Bacillota bacterium]
MDSQSCEKLSELLFPHVDKTPEDMEAAFPARDLPEGAKVTRIGPSPTGFVHLGNLYNAAIGERLAHQSGGLIILRVEDTDAKREVPGAVETLLAMMDFFGVPFDEGVLLNEAGEPEDRGDYGPYRQRQRKEIYQTVAKDLVKKGRAYPCFCTEEELAALREQQQAQKLNFGYYGPFAKCRDLTLEQIEEKLAQGRPWVLRYKSMGDPEKRTKVLDAVRGELDMPENDQDLVLLKSDGIPTYHFAHVVDDHLMRVTHVVRGEEWLATLPMHVQLFDELGWERPVYCHTAQLMKMDGEVKRKLSKRKDPELALEYYRADGYLPEAVWEYLLTVLNSNFEEWRLENPEADLRDFAFTTEKMSTSGALFDLAKLEDISKEALWRMPAEQVYEGLLDWCEEYDPAFAALLAADKDYACRAIDLGRHDERPRKDLVTWKQARDFLSFYYDAAFRQEDPFPERVDEAARAEIVRAYLDAVDYGDDNSAWFDKVRDICTKLGYAAKPKDFKKHPEDYRGSIVDVSNTIRVGLTGRANSPDLWQVSQLLGEATCRRRLEKLL